tara:strand:+ start:230 stop:565 length:336 start_codon:yes stop_codon:yes gene_type:complete
MNQSQTLWLTVFAGMAELVDARDLKSLGLAHAGSTPAPGTMSKTEEKVKHPNHYNQGIEVIDFIDSWNFSFTEGNIIKYVCRHRFKNNSLEDLEKAKFYLERLINSINIQG